MTTESQGSGGTDPVDSSQDDVEERYPDAQEGADPEAPRPDPATADEDVVDPVADSEGQDIEGRYPDAEQGSAEVPDRDPDDPNPVVPSPRTGG